MLELIALLINAGSYEHAHSIDVDEDLDEDLFRYLGLLDTPAWAFNGDFCTYICVNMRGSKKFCQRGSNFNGFFG